MIFLNLKKPLHVIFLHNLKNRKNPFFFFNLKIPLHFHDFCNLKHFRDENMKSSFMKFRNYFRSYLSRSADSLRTQ